MMDSTQRKQMIKNAFDTVAEGYDHPSLAFFPDTADHLLNLIQLDDSSSVLDVCTGTGMVALKAARLLVNGNVTGIDLSPGMLQQARQKAELSGLNNTRFINMDLDHLDFNDSRFDVATCSFGLFFIDDMVRALKNISGAVKAGGSIVISSFTGNAFDPFSQMFLDCYQSFGKEVPPLSWKRLESEDKIRAVFNQAGIDDVSLYQQPLGYVMKSEQHWWDVVWNAGYRGLLNQLTDEHQIEFKNRHLAEVAEYCQNNDAWLDTSVIIAVGRK